MVRKTTFIFFVFLLSSQCLAGDFHFPEPMVYDLMRGLDSKKNELEINALLLNRDEINPEIEYAVRDGFGVELEIPSKNGKVEAVKLGVQRTLYLSNNLHVGMQSIYENDQLKNQNHFTFTPVINYKLTDRVALVGIFGFRGSLFEGVLCNPAFVFNLSAFYQFTDRIWIGMENDKDLTFLNGRIKVESIPQISIKLKNQFRLQMGLGYNWNDRVVNPIERLIYEF